MAQTRISPFFFEKLTPAEMEDQREKEPEIAVIHL